MTQRTRVFLSGTLLIYIFSSLTCLSDDGPSVSGTNRLGSGSAPSAFSTEVARKEVKSPLYLVAVGDVSNELRLRVVSHLEESLFCRVSSSTSHVSLAGSPLLLREAIEPMTGQSVFGVVAIVNSETNAAYEHAIELSDRMAFVVIQRLYGQTGDARDPAEIMARNVEREACFAGARLLGMPPCPMPLCALCENPEDKGRNLCPPCQGKLKELLQSKSIEPLQR
jgi:hypothetical protein